MIINKSNECCSKYEYNNKPTDKRSCTKSYVYTNLSLSILYALTACSITYCISNSLARRYEAEYNWRLAVAQTKYNNAVIQLEKIRFVRMEKIREREACISNQIYSLASVILKKIIIKVS